MAHTTYVHVLHPPPLRVVEAFILKDPECVNYKDGYSHTIVHCAAFYDHLDIITLAMDQVSLSLSTVCVL